MKSYSKWYGVDLLCAIKELEILGHRFSERYEKQIEISIENKANSNRRRKEERENRINFPYDHDDQFSFIAGYTENGVPFGITYDEEE